jgi:hypothetical protein
MAMLECQHRDAIISIWKTIRPGPPISNTELVLLLLNLNPRLRYMIWMHESTVDPNWRSRCKTSNKGSVWLASGSVLWPLAFTCASDYFQLCTIATQGLFVHKRALKGPREESVRRRRYFCAQASFPTMGGLACFHTYDGRHPLTTPVDLIALLSTCMLPRQTVANILCL